MRVHPQQQRSETDLRHTGEDALAGTSDAQPAPDTPVATAFQTSDPPVAAAPTTDDRPPQAPAKSAAQAAADAMRASLLASAAISGTTTKAPRRTRSLGPGAARARTGAGDDLAGMGSDESSGMSAMSRSTSATDYASVRDHLTPPPRASRSILHSTVPLLIVAYVLATPGILPCPAHVQI